MEWREMVASDFAHVEKSYEENDLEGILTNIRFVLKDIRLELIYLHEQVERMENDLDDSVEAVLDNCLEDKIREVLEDMAWKRAQSASRNN